METLGNELGANKGHLYFCEKCDFKCLKKYSWERHLTTSKHVKEINGTNLEIEKGKKGNKDIFQCENCNKIFITKAGLWKHKKKCTINNNDTINDNINDNINDTINELAKKIIDKDELIMFLIKENTEFKNIILDQQNKMFEHQNIIMKVMENGTTSNSHNTNSYNKAFNLQFFLNETCKDAMNLTDFIDSIKLQLSDLEKFGEIGYVEGISNIITTNLKALDVSLRPVHCTDKKRETIYIKEHNQWSKEDDNKSKLRKVIKTISNKNIKLLPQFREKYPDYKNSSSRISDKYDKMVIEVMTSDLDKDDKIIKNISNATTIEKI
jgi:hypothetical protein